MLNGKQRAYLRGLAIGAEPVVQIGKNGVTPEVTKSADEALAARELIKISVLANSMTDAREVAEILRERTRSQVVGVTGGKITLYRAPNPGAKTKPVIELPK